MDETFETPGHLQLELRTPAGTIRVRAEETAQTHVSISGERNPDDIRIVFDGARPDQQHLSVEHRQRGKVFGFSGGDLRVDVTVPLGSDVTCDSGSADLEITGRIASLGYRSGSGDCRFDHVEGEANIKAASGDLAGATVGGNLSFTSASGDARVRAIAGDVGGKTASGDVSLGTVGGSVRLNVVSGDVQIGSVRSGSTVVRSVSGDVEIGVARGTRVYLDLSSTSGDTVSELDMSGVSDSGGTDMELQVNTVSGDIRIARAASSPEDAYAAEDSASAE